MTIQVDCFEFECVDNLTLKIPSDRCRPRDDLEGILLLSSISVRSGRENFDQKMFPSGNVPDAVCPEPHFRRPAGNEALEGNLGAIANLGAALISLTLESVAPGYVVKHLRPS